MSTLLERRRAMMMANATPPDGQLEWVETDGSAYIDTGIVGAQPKSAKMTARIGDGSVSGCLMGAYYGSSTTTRRFIFARYLSSDQKIHTYFHTSGDISVSCADSVLNNTPFDIEAALNRNNQKISIKESGGTWVTATGTNGSNSTGIATILIFAAHGVNSVTWHSSSGTRIMSAQIFSDVNFTTKVRDYLPWRYNGIVGLWDNVSQTFFAPQGGTLTGGPNVI